MKKIIFLFAICAVFAIGCQDNFLDTAPYDALSEKQFWKNEAQALSGVTGVYQNLLYENVYGYYFRRDAITPTVATHMGVDLPFTTGTVAARGVGIVDDTWKELYRGVQRANDVLSRLPDVPGINEDKRARFIAEIKFLRALHYFNLLDYFGGVPIYDKPVIIKEAYKSRNTAEEVREFILKDLNEAIKDLPATVDENGRATKGAAIALRGKVYLYNQQWAEAEADMQTVMELGLYNLHPDYAELFTVAHENASEFIFSVQFMEQEELGNDFQFRLGCMIHVGNDNRNNYTATNILVDSYENLDGSPFVWDDIIPGFSSMTSKQKDVIFLRDDITDSERAQFLSTPELEALYIEGGNEARIKKAWENRDPRLNATVILPYTTTIGNGDIAYTRRWPYRNRQAPEFDIRNGGSSGNSPIHPFRKFVIPGSNLLNMRWGPINFPVIRYADVLLMFAEARNETTGLDPAVFNAINQVRTRAGIPALQNTDPSAPTYVGSTAEMRERIRKERAVEFVLEGVYYGDVRRWNIGDQINNHVIEHFNGSEIRTRKWLNHFNLWPIPANEIDMNPKLTQNPGWEN